MGLLYGACDTPRDVAARRIAYLIDEQGRIVEAHAKVDPAAYPADQLSRV